MSSQAREVVLVDNLRDFSPSTLALALDQLWPPKLTHTKAFPSSTQLAHFFSQLELKNQRLFARPCNMEENEYIRLHVTPFNPALLKTILPPSVLPKARNISYHEIATFPEKAYGYVELPLMDADKLKKKLNGTILKGTKVRIEKARKEKKRAVGETMEEPEKSQKGRTQKRKRGELPGVDIGERQVKRGWTTPVKDLKKDQMATKSKYTTKPECLFKTNLPPNVASKGRTADAKPDKRKRKAGKEAVVHEFAKTTKFATFLRSSGASRKTTATAEFVEGRGWVDEEGNLVEGVKVKKLRKSDPMPVIEEGSSESAEVEHAKVLDQQSLSDADSKRKHSGKRTSTKMESSNTETDSFSDSDSSSDEEEEEEVALPKTTNDHDMSVSPDDSSDDSSDEVSNHKSASSPTPLGFKKASQEKSSSSDESSDEEDGGPLTKVQAAQDETSSSSDSSSSDSSEEQSDSDSSDDSEAGSEVVEPQSSSATKPPGVPIPSLSLKIPDSLDSTPIASSVHPLEALYKKDKPDAMHPSKAAETSFSFFGVDNDDDDESEVQAETHLQAPLTPYTKKDFEYRGLRSSAPTPDTAHANKRFVWPSENDPDEGDEAVTSSPTRDTDIKGKGKSEGKEKEKATEAESDFSKWFYENRGDLRRAWTGRRKSAAKEKRQRENRKREHRAI